AGRRANDSAERLPSMSTTNTTPHLVAPEEIMALLDHELSSDRAQSVSAHLEFCAECRAVMQQLQQTRESAILWQVGLMPSTIEDRIKTTATKAFTTQGSSSPAILQWADRWTGKQWAFGLALVAAVFLVILFAATPSWLRSTADLVTAARPETEGHGSGNGRGPVSSDSNGVFHDLGGEAQNSFSVNGKLVSEQESHALIGPMIARTVSLSLFTK